MRAIFLAAVAVAALPLTGTDARAAPWCAHYGTDNGTNCGFYTIEQCRAALSAVGRGYCTPNPLDTATNSAQASSARLELSIKRIADARCGRRPSIVWCRAARSNR